MKHISTLDLKGKRVLIRVDFNVPLKAGIVKDDTRLKAALPTLRYCLRSGAKQIILMSHLGRPADRYESRFSLSPVARRLGVLLSRPVTLVPLAGPLPQAPIILLDNLRFDPGEKKNDKKFAMHLASFADVYINDAFGASHRKHASIHAIASLLPSAGGLLLEKELQELDVLKYDKPIVAIVGFAKLSDKIGILEGIIKRVDKVLIGGGVMFTFLKAQGYEIGTSLVEEDQVKTAKSLLKKYSTKIVLPLDVVEADEAKTSAHREIVNIDEMHAKGMGLDVGVATLTLFKEVLMNARTVIWNGPVGMYEVKPFDRGSREIARFLASHQQTIKTIVGGGDTAAMINAFRLSDKMHHVSTGGGASLEILAGMKLPGVEVLK